MICWQPGEPPLAPASNPESPPPSTSPLLFDEENPLSEPKGNIAASSSEPTVGESPAFPASNSEDVPQDGKLVKCNVKAPPPTPQSTSSSNPPTSDDACPYAFMSGKLVEVPKAYPKGAKGRLVDDQRFIRELEELLPKDIRDACARNTNPRAKPEASDTNSDLIYKHPTSCSWAHAIIVACEECSWPEVTGLRWYRWPELRSRWRQQQYSHFDTACQRPKGKLHFLFVVMMSMLHIISAICRQ